MKTPPSQIDNIGEIGDALLTSRGHEIGPIVELLINEALDCGDAREGGEYAMRAVKLIDAYNIELLVRRTEEAR